MYSLLTAELIQQDMTMIYVVAEHDVESHNTSHAF